MADPARYLELQRRNIIILKDVGPTVTDVILDGVASARIAAVAGPGIGGGVEKLVKWRRRVRCAVGCLPRAVYQRRKGPQVHVLVFRIVQKLIDLRELAGSNSKQVLSVAMARSERKIDVPGQEVPPAFRQGVVEEVVFPAFISVAVPVADGVADR